MMKLIFTTKNYYGIQKLNVPLNGRCAVCPTENEDYRSQAMDAALRTLQMCLFVYFRVVVYFRSHEIRCRKTL